MQLEIMPDTSTQRLLLVSIETHPRFQPRGTTTYRKVREYTAAMKAGKQFPPIHVGRLGQKLYIIDGHHRLEAATLAGHTAIEAIVKPYRTLNDAHRAALQCNQAHGKPMTNAEKRHAFQAYIDADLHIHDGEDLSTIAGTIKAVRLIAAECPVYSYQHIHKKLKELGIEAPRDDVKPYRPDYGDDWDGPSEEDLETEDAIHLAAFRDHLATAMTSLSLLSDHVRATALWELKEAPASLAPQQKPLSPLSV